MKLSRGTLFLGAALILSGAWLSYYATGAAQRTAEPAVRTAVNLPAPLLQRYAGDYDLGGEIFSLTVRDGRLYAGRADSPQDPQLELLADSATHFFVRDSPGELVATFDDHGRVAGFTFIQDNRSREVRKVR